MRTSMNLPDGLLAEAKARAAADGTTVTALVIEGLRSELSSRANEEASPSVMLPTRHLGHELMDISDNRAVRDALDHDGSAFDDRP